jgi:DNA-directed RNA polymerase subunit RPC12/RpoP
MPVALRESMYVSLASTESRIFQVPKMAAWVLNCLNCGSTFKHSEIDDTALANYFSPVKPEFPVPGLEVKCPNCGTKATYRRHELRYQA